MTDLCIHATQAVLAIGVPVTTWHPWHTTPETALGCRDARK